MVELNKKFPKSAFQVTLFRLSVSGEPFLAGNLDLSVAGSLNYDFVQECDSRYSYFWRNLYKLNDKDYQQFFIDNADLLKKSIQNSEFDLQYYDLTPYFLSYTLSMNLNSVAEALILDINTGEIEIKENDMIIIEETALSEDNSFFNPKPEPTSQIIFMGFVTNITNTLGYGDFLTQKITILNLGKMYSLAKITTDPALAEYAIKGLQDTNVDFPVHTDTFNEKNVFEIIKQIYESFFFANAIDDEADVIEYTINEDKAKAFENFNVLFPFVYTLYLYKQKYNPKFLLCQIKNGKHKAWNEAIRGAVKVWLPSYKNANEIMTSALTGAMYDYFFDYDGKLIVRPPLYNFFPLNNFSPTNSDTVAPLFYEQGDYVITRDMIMEYDYIKDNMDTQTRTDAYFMFPYVGEFNQTLPQFYLDLPAFIKFGFRNETPYNNPNAMSEKTARILAMIYNLKVNNGSRTLNIKIKTDKPLVQYKYQLGRVYYIDLPDLKSVGTAGGEIQRLIDKETRVTNAGVMGYLVGIKKGYEYGSFIVYDLTFTYIRDIEILDLDTVPDNLLDNVLDDLYSIYGDNPLDADVDPYGFLGKLQLKDGAVTEAEYNLAHTEAITKFKLTLMNNNYYHNIPIFKTMPSVMNLIDLTYSDADTQNAIESNNKKNADTSTLSDTPSEENGLLVYKSYRFKMERFFDYDIDGGVFKFKNPRSELPYRVTVKNNPFQDSKAEAELTSQFNNAILSKGYNKTFTNYENMPNTLDKFTLITGEVKVKNKPAILPDNSKIAQFKARMSSKSASGDDFTRISQKLFNRIIEADAELMKLLGFPYTPSLFWKNSGNISNPNNMDDERGIGWDKLVVGQQQQIYPYLYNSINSWTYSLELFNPIPFLYSVPNLQKSNFPVGYLIETNNIGGTTNIVATDRVNPDDWNTNTATLDIGMAGGFFSPAFFFNLQTILHYNTLTSVISEEDAKKFTEKGVTDGSAKTNKHRNGLAIDFILPAREDMRLDAQGKILSPTDPSYTEIAYPMPFVMFGLNGNYTLTNNTYTQFETILGKYFDKVIKSKSVLNVDRNVLKGIPAKDAQGNPITPDMVKMGVYVYHIEVTDKKFLNMDSEVFKQAPQGAVIPAST